MTCRQCKGIAGKGKRCERRECNDRYIAVHGYCTYHADQNCGDLPE